jgi:hypothetical protein
MKKFTLLLFAGLCALIMSCVSSNTITADSYSSSVTTMSSVEGDMCSAVDNLRSAATPSEIETAAIALEAIRKEEPGNWLAHYHTAYAYGRIAHSCENIKEVDNWVTKAEAAIADAAKCEGADASEVYVIESYLHYASIRVNPMIRGYKLSKTAMDKLSKAVKANGNNPRAYLLIAQHLINVPVMLGGDPDKACKYNDAAQKTYEAEASAEGRDPLIASWGRSESDEIASSLCDEDSDSKRK